MDEVERERTETATDKGAESGSVCTLAIVLYVSTILLLLGLLIMVSIS